jgi:hypothetical protein
VLLFTIYACHSVLGVGYDGNQEEPSQSFGGGGGQPSRSRNNSNIIPKQRQAPVHTASLGFLFYNFQYCIVDCAFMLQVFNEILEFIPTLSISPLNLSWWKSISTAMLSL